MKKNNAGTMLMKRVIAKYNTLKRTLPTLLGNLAVNHFKSSFRQQGFENESVQKWAARKKSEKGSSRATLVKSGALRRSIRIAYATLPKTSIISDLPYSYIHNYGGNGRAWGRHPFKMQQRRFMGFSHSLNKKSALLINRKLYKVF
jgi:phage gpG-like protein